MPKVSVVMPCLNMVNYITECLDSVVAQTLSDIEILVIDAGSTDGTLDILQSYADRDFRIKIIHSDKRSYGYQVNMGIAVSKGEYIAIVDTDDRIKPDMYEKLYLAADKAGADYVKGTAEMFYTISDKRTYRLPVLQFPEEAYEKNAAIEVLPYEMPKLLTTDNFLWYGIYRSNFMKQIKLHESPGAAFQDLGGLLQTQMIAQKAIYLKDSFYEYRQDNVQASGYNPKGFQFVWEEYTWAEQFVEGASGDWAAAFYRKFFLHTLDRYYAMTASEKFWEDSHIDMIRNKLRSGLKKEIIKEADFLKSEWEDLQLFLEDKHALYDKYFKSFLLKKQQMTEIMEMSNKGKVIIFGFGQLGMFIHAQILKHGLGNVIAYCDNQEEKQGSTFWGISILKPEKAVILYPDACFVIANRRNSWDMKNQLKSMGVRQERICCYTAGVDGGLFRTKIFSQI